MYLLFCWNTYYPEGGWNDFCGILDKDDLVGLGSHPAVAAHDNAHLVVLHGGEVIMVKNSYQVVWVDPLV